jgi:hypothetical protein
LDVSKLGTISAEQATLLDADVLISLPYAIENPIPPAQRGSKKSWATP